MLVFVKVCAEDDRSEGVCTSAVFQALQREVQEVVPPWGCPYPEELIFGVPGVPCGHPQHPVIAQIFNDVQGNM